MARRLCSQCGLDYNLIAHRPAEAGRLRRVRGGAASPGRTTTPRRWPSGWPSTTSETKPLIEIFERKEFVATFDATRPVEEVQAAIRQRFDLPARTPRA